MNEVTPTMCTQSEPLLRSHNVRGRKILCLDGGGSRGVITLTFLRYLESQLQGRHIYQMFDLIVGTSAGSIVTTMLTLPDTSSPTKPRYSSVDDMLKDFITNVPRIFCRSYYHMLSSLFGVVGPKFPAYGQQEVLEEMTQGTHMSQLLTDVLITTTSISPSVEYVEFTRSKARSNPIHFDICVSDAVMCSTSAPTYFPAHSMTIHGEEYKFVDGGMSANSPVMAGVNEAIQLYGMNGGPYYVLSIGTGYELLDHGHCSNGGMVQWASPVSTNMLASSASFAKCQTSKILREGKTYFRLDLPLPSHLNYMDNVSPASLEEMITLTECYIKCNPAEMDRICEVFMS